MNISYNYEIINVDAAARCMEIVYSAEGHQTLHIGARLPYEGETVEAVVRMYAPVRYWEEQAVQVIVPQVGMTGQVAPPESPQPTPEQIIQQFTAAIQLRLDTFARTRNYDGILSACTYATSTVPKFQGEGQYCVNARDATWAAAYDILAEVQGGTRPMPNSITDIETELPVLVWPS